jgi:hypothetical protein
MRADVRDEVGDDGRLRRAAHQPLKTASDCGRMAGLRRLRSEVRANQTMPAETPLAVQLGAAPLSAGAWPGMCASIVQRVDCARPVCALYLARPPHMTQSGRRKVRCTRVSVTAPT